MSGIGEPQSHSSSQSPPPLPIQSGTSLRTRSHTLSMNFQSSGRFRKPSSTKDKQLATRRIIAEDSTYNLETVPPLVELVLRHIIDNFSFNYSALPFLNREQKRIVLDSLSLDIPLKVIAHTITDELFWQRICLSRWPSVDVIKHDNSWKQAFFEKHLEQMIHEYVPGQTYPVWIEEALEFGAPYVRRIDIKEMLPPVKSMKHEDGEIFQTPPPPSVPGDGDENSDSEEESNEFNSKVDHLDLGFVIAKLDRMTHLGVQYRVKDVGLDFEWSQFQFTGRDCISFSNAIKAHTFLSVLELVNSRVDCERCRVLVGHLLDHPSLTVLNLSHNIISDWGARALGKLINGRSKLESLDLMNNRLTAEGGEALSHALTKGAKTLRHLNLRLNKLRDGGASAIARSLLRNTSLAELNLATNDLGDPAILMFGQVLTHNFSLKKLDLSNNRIGVEAGRKLQECIASNQALVHLDLRFTGIPQVSEFTLHQTIEANDNRIRLENERKTADGVFRLPGIISVAVPDKMPVFEKAKLRETLFSL